MYKNDLNCADKESNVIYFSDYVKHPTIIDLEKKAWHEELLSLAEKCCTIVDGDTPVDEVEFINLPNE